MGLGIIWEKARKMQQKMSSARSHVQSRINEITNLLAPPQDKHEGKDPATELNSTEAAQTLSATNKPTQPEMSTRCTTPQDVLLEEVSTAPPPYTEDDPESRALTAWKNAQGWV